MNRPPSTPIPEFPAWPRRKRSLTEEERALWESIAKQTKPLRKKPRPAKASADLPDAEALSAAKPAASPKPLPAAKMTRTSLPAAPPLAPLGRRERSQLSRGRKEI